MTCNIDFSFSTTCPIFCTTWCVSTPSNHYSISRSLFFKYYGVKLRIHKNLLHVGIFKSFPVRGYIASSSFDFKSKSSHLQNKQFVFKYKFQRNASKFPIFIWKENPSSFFIFHYEQLSFFPYECPGLCRHRAGHSLGGK